ncbi:FUSC family protein [Cystobacter fuscus]|uniref:FUSC family protein n=1 Tax=Cystobacter fuscus TaxID=43 RepID=UPI002B305797|nr:FUSC family protein [Cystobacter fuscus]
MMRRLVEHAREAVRFAPVKPAVMAGIRAAIATIFPVVVATALGLPDGVWLSLGGFNVSFADKGGSYRARATSMASGLIVGALAAFLGAVAGEHPVLTIVMVLLWVTACSFAGVYGVAASVVGNTAASAFVVSLAFASSGLGEALERGGMLALGGLWAMFLSLVLWPIRPYRPSRLAVAQCFRDLAEYAGEVNRVFTGEEDGSLWQGLIQRHHARIRETLEVAGSTLAATRRGRGESQRGEQLLVLLQIADTMFGTVIALSDVMESLPRERRTEPAWRLVERSVAGFCASLQTLARGVETEGKVKPLPPLEWGLEPPESPRPAAGTEERAKYLYALRLLAQLRDFMGAATRTETRLADPNALRQTEPLPWTQWMLGPVRDNLSLDSMVLRHALRVGLTTTVAVCVSLAFIPSHGHWVTITVLTIMQPYTGATFLKGLQRVGGTVVGGILAAAAASSIQQYPQALPPLLFITVATSIAVIPLNYGLYTAFLTLTFVLLAEMGTGDWGLARVRILNTLIGGALALAGTWLLWERSEHQLLPEQISAALRANREHFLQVFANRREPSRDPQEGFSEARRKMGLATLNAEASFQRLLSEPRRRTEPLEPLMTLLAYLRRFAASVVALSATPGEAFPERSRALLDRFADTVSGVLEDLADAVVRGRPPSPLPDLEGWLRQAPLAAEHAEAGAEEESLLRIQLERVTRRLIVLHGAVSRRGTRSPLERTSGAVAAIR